MISRIIRHPATVRLLSAVMFSPDKGAGGPADEYGEWRPKSQLDRDFLDYHTICARHGFDSFQAAEFLKSHASDFRLQHLARALNRLIMKMFVDDHRGQESDDDLSR
ncbi:MAG TPA: hypothetical protein VHC22_12870 [Pirellulales bacterium]|nr:hypothetical protein [Pirellulales bacterium]